MCGGECVNLRVFNPSIRLNDIKSLFIILLIKYFACYKF